MLDDIFGDLLESLFGESGTPNQGGSGMAMRQASARTSGISAEGESSSHVVELQERLNRQSLVIQTLVAACIKNDLFTGVEFKDLMDEIDASDGRMDGQSTPNRSPKVCPGCGKTCSYKAHKCMYCGDRLEDGVVL